MLPLPSHDPSIRPYLPSMDYGYSGFLGGAYFPPPHPPPPSLHNAFMSPRQRDETVWRAQYEAHMTALQSHVDSFIQSLRLPTPDSSGKPMQKKVFSNGNSPDDIVANGSSSVASRAISTSRVKSSPKLLALPKLHTSGGHQLPSSRSSFHSPSLSRANEKYLPPLHLPTVKPQQLPDHLLQTDEKEKRRNLADVKTVEMKSPQHCVVANDSNDQATGTKIPRLPPLLIGNKDLAKKLSEEEQGAQRLPNFQDNTGKVQSDSKKPQHHDSNDGNEYNAFADRRDQITETNGGYQNNFSLSSGSWVEDATTNIGRKPYCMPHLSNDLSDIEVMRDAYVLGNSHLQKFSASSSNSCTTVSKHTAASNLSGIPRTKNQRQLSPPPPGMLPSAHPGIQSFPYPVRFRKAFVDQLSESYHSSDINGSEQPSYPTSVAAASNGNPAGSSFGAERL